MIELTKDLSVIVRRELKISDERTFFTKEELARVTYASINRDDMDVIKYFTNLSVLDLVFFPSLTSKDLDYIAEKIPSIYSIKIKEQNAIYRLDLSKFVNLKELAVIHNDNVVDLVGIDNVTRLTFYDNKEYKNIKQIVEYLKEGMRLTLDFSLYIGIIRELAKENREYLVDNITWVESLGLRKFNVHEFSKDEISFIINFISNIASKYININDGVFEKFGILYKWMIDNIKFINEDDTDDNKHKLDNSFDVFFNREGGRLSYAKAFQYLLAYVDIDSMLVYSYGALDSIGYFNGEKVSYLLGTSDYALLRINLNNRNYYCDVAWDSMINHFKYSDALRLFLVSKEELSLRHRFVGEGNIVNSYSYNGDDSDDLIMFSMDRIRDVNILFAELEEIDKQIISYQVNKTVFNSVYNSKEINGYQFPEERLILDYSIKVQDEYLKKLLDKKKEAIGKSSLELKKRYIANNDVKKYLDELKKNYRISNRLYSILKNL